MVQIRYAEASDREFWYQLDRHLPETEFEHKVHRRQGYILSCNGIPAGILRYNLFWDNTPFCTLLYIKEEFRGKGYGKKMMDYWEKDMKKQGYGMLLTSTQTDETAQHFYRKTGYKDCGALIMTIPGYEQPMEMFLAKEVK